MSSMKSVLYFQDILRGPPQPPGPGTGARRRHGGHSPQTNEAAAAVDPAEAFFELANVPWVGYRIDRRIGGGEEGADDPEDDDGESCSVDSVGGGAASAAVVVRQNNAVLEHTGGIVWETSFLLATFLLGRYAGGEQDADVQRRGGREKRPLGKVLEIGSGCGMLGLVLAASGLCKKAVLTETTEVMKELCANVERNVKSKTESNEKCGGSSSAKDNILPARPSVSSKRVLVHRLRWDNLDEDIAASGGDLRPHSFDTIVGTDVVFSVKLVQPLLRTLAKMAHGQTVVYLCLQIRCADSHRTLLEKAQDFGFRVEDCTEDLRAMPGCWWGLELECKLMRFVTVAAGDGLTSKRRGNNTDHGRKKKQTKAEEGNGTV